jgi:uncharacterized phage-associated protein
MVKFKLDPEKVVNALAYFSSKCTGTTKMKVCKLLYYSDKEHLLRYGRPITGDKYVRMQWGPTPSAGLNLLRGTAPTRLKAMFQAKVSVHGNEVRNLTSADLNVFSRSDIQVMDEIVERYGRMTAAQLSKLSHKEATWLKTTENCLIDFEKFFEGRPDGDATLELLLDENRPTRSKASHALA